jgi:hypothetical protein
VRKKVRDRILCRPRRDLILFFSLSPGRALGLNSVDFHERGMVVSVPTFGPAESPGMKLFISEWRSTFRLRGNQ